MAGDGRHIQDFYTFGEVLGQGSYSVVKTGYSVPGRTKVAIKIITRSRLRPSDEEVKFIRLLQPIALPLPIMA